MTIDKVVDVIAMRNRLMPAARAVNVVGAVPGAAVLGGAGVGVGLGNRQTMLLHRAVGVDVVQVAVVQVVDVAVVLHPGVFAVRAMLVIVVGVQLTHEATFVEGRKKW